MARRRGSGVPTRQRIVAAALEEFAARGFDGAKVDRIASRADANKAMVYYHCPSKAALYLEILKEQFGALGEAVAASRTAGASPDDQLRVFIATIAREALERPYFPAIWLREIAEGGRHIDRSIVLALRRVLETLAAILAAGEASGRFVRANPLVVQISIVAPLMFFAASAPFRDRAIELAPSEFPRAELGAMIAHVQASTLATLTAATPGAGARPRRRAKARRPVASSSHSRSRRR
jgi:AcrR family transcriptional regulator